MSEKKKRREMERGKRAEAEAWETRWKRVSAHDSWGCVGESWAFSYNYGVYGTRFMGGWRET